MEELNTPQEPQKGPWERFKSLDLGLDPLYPEIDKERSDRVLEGLGNTWPAKAVKGAAHAAENLVKGPWEAYSKGMTTEEMVGITAEAAVELGAGGVVTAPARGATLGIFGGMAAKYPLNNLDHALELNKRGFAPSEIKQRTGWDQGKEGKWRFEIDDSVSTFKPKKLPEQLLTPVKLPEVLRHSELYFQYPFLKEAMVVVREAPNPRTRASVGFTEDGAPVIFFNKQFVDKESKNPDTLKSTILHEIQHLIQYAERFGKGASHKNAGKFVGKESLQAFKEFEEAVADEGFGSERVRYLSGYVDDIIKWEDYSRVSGEVESRNVQTRMSMTAEQRKNSAAVTTEDYPRHQQTVKNVDVPGPWENYK